jgi:protein TonB
LYSYFERINNSSFLGSAITASIALHVFLIALFLNVSNTTVFLENSMRSIEKSSITLSFVKPKPQPVIEKKPIKKLVKPVKETPVIKEHSIVTPKQKAFVQEEITEQKPIEKIADNNNAPIKEVSNNTVIKDASFKGTRIAPKYPKRALMLGLEGRVVIKALIDTDGKIKDIKVLDSSGYTILDKAVTKVAWKWKFEPSYVNGKPTTQWVKAPYEFVIR